MTDKTNQTEDQATAKKSAGPATQNQTQASKAKLEKEKQEQDARKAEQAEKDRKEAEEQVEKDREEAAANATVAPVPNKPANEKERVKVRNLQDVFYRQPSTNIRIEGHAEEMLADDQWLELQVRTGILKKV